MKALLRFNDNIVKSMHFPAGRFFILRFSDEMRGKWEPEEVLPDT